MKIQTFIILIILASTVPSANGQIPNAEIVSYSYSPITPTPGMDIIILATISVPPQNIDNITIVYGINDQNETRALMQNLGGTQFQYVIQGQENGTVIHYWLELYVLGALEDRKPTTGFEQIQVLNLAYTPLPIDYGRPIDLPTGNFSLISEDGNLKLNLTVDGSISITITRQPLSEVTPPVNFLATSDKFSIEVNSTESINAGEIQLTYSQEVVDQIGAIEQRLQLLKIENGIVETINATLDPIKNIMTASVKSFSEWIIASEKPNLKIIDVSIPSAVKKEEPFPLGFILSNLGNSKAVNITLLVFLPRGMNIVNNSSRFEILELNPLQNVSFSFLLLVEETGNYTIVISVEAGDGIQESEPITLTVKHVLLSTSKKEIAFNEAIQLITFFIIIKKKTIRGKQEKIKSEK